MLGLSLASFTLLHVVISLIGLVAGVAVMLGLIASQRLYGTWNHVFLITTILTSITGFMFPFEKVLPSHVTGLLSLLVLAPAAAALYWRGLAGSWRLIYIVTASIALYLNAFVGTVQAFLKIPALKALAPTQSEAPFLVAQLAVLALFAAMSWAAASQFKRIPLQQPART